MKKVTVCSIIGIIIFWTLMFACSCSTCPPASKITNGEALEKWERKHGFRGASNFRVMWIRKTGPFYKVRFENKKESFNDVFKMLPDWCIEGRWISSDSIAKYSYHG